MFKLVNQCNKPLNRDLFITVAGNVGAGKSTLINLIPRFYDVTGGEILVDGVNIKDVKMHDLRDKIGFVPQKGVLFTGTVESNVKYANENITNARKITNDEYNKEKMQQKKSKIK